MRGDELNEQRMQRTYNLSHPPIVWRVAAQNTNIIRDYGVADGTLLCVGVEAAVGRISVGVGVPVGYGSGVRVGNGVAVGGTLVDVGRSVGVAGGLSTATRSSIQYPTLDLAAGTVPNVSNRNRSRIICPR